MDSKMSSAITTYILVLVLTLIAVSFTAGESSGNGDTDDKEEKDYKGPESCCQKLLISGTLNQDEWYQDMMGIFTIYDDLPWIFYENLGDINGKYPVYIHNFTNFKPTEERPDPPRVFLYFYFNENKNYPETQCKEDGCWIISMYDAMPGNFWFGKKWFYIKHNGSPPKCPDDLTSNGKRFINQDNKFDDGLTIKCIDKEEEPPETDQKKDEL